MSGETDAEFLKRLKLDVKFTVQQIMTLSDAVRLFALARRGAAVQAALPAGPISQAQYNEALLTVSRLTGALRIVRDLNKNAEGWTYSQEIEDEIAVISAALVEERT